MVRNIQYTTITRILDDLSDHPLLRDVTLDTAIRYAIRFVELHGYPQLFLDKLADVEIHHFRGELPCDLISIDQVRDKCSGICLRAMTKSFNPGLKEPPQHTQERHISQFPNLANGYRNPMVPPPYMEGMDRMCDHPHHHHFHGHEMSFKTQGRIIYTSFPEGTVEMAYKSIPVDEQGLPLLIDDENYLAALEAYIKVRVFTVKFDTGKISDKVLENAKQDYAWLSAQLMDTMTIPSVSEMESISRMWNNLVSNRHEFEHQFNQFSRNEVSFPYGTGPSVIHGVTIIKETSPQEKTNGDDPTVNNETLVWDDDKED